MSTGGGPPASLTALPFTATTDLITASAGSTTSVLTESDTVPRPQSIVAVFVSTRPSAFCGTSRTWASSPKMSRSPLVTTPSGAFTSVPKSIR